MPCCSSLKRLCRLPRTKAFVDESKGASGVAVDPSSPRVKITAPSRLSLPVVAVFRSRRSANAVAIAIEKSQNRKSRLGFEDRIDEETSETKRKTKIEAPAFAR